MCGIAGFLTSAPCDEGRRFLDRMSRLATHRGPDDEGAVLFAADGTPCTADATDASVPSVAGLAHRRLAILDRSESGHQPMADSTGRYWIVHNGEVYNYREVRSELQALGCSFRSQSDTEVILQAYVHWGPACLGRFNGMWAFAIYDRAERRLFCARDRFGVKPFQYVALPRRFAFASEAKQLLELDWVPRRASLTLLADLFLWGLENHTDESFFEHVARLPASHYAVVDERALAAGRIEPVRYWEPQPEPVDNEHDAIERFRSLLHDAVRLRLRSDVPVGVTLSGGLDSSSAACVAGRVRAEGPGEPLTAFHVEYEGAGYSERAFAARAAQASGASLVVLQPGALDLARGWEAFVWHMEQPVAGLSYYSNFQILRLIRDHGVPVVLSGQGGDELLLGYERYRTYELLFALRQGRLGRVFREIRHSRRHGSMPLVKQALYGLYFSLPCLRARRRRALVRPFLRRGFFEEFSRHETHLRREAVHANLRSLQESEFFHYQLPHLLHHDDRMSMAHAVETRLPFLDYRLLELVLGIPSALLLRNGWSKYLLRVALDGVLPDEVRWRNDKMGYETPTGRLIRANREMSLDLLARHSRDEVVDTAALAGRFDDERVDERLLCAALTYLCWKEKFGLA